MKLGSIGVFVILICYLNGGLIAQHNQVNFPLNKWSQNFLDKHLTSYDSLPTSHVKPNIISSDKLYEMPGFKADTGKYYFDATYKLYADNLIRIDKPDLFVTIDPI